MKEAVSVVGVKNYNFPDVLFGVDKSLQLLGGIEKFIRPESKVLIKPNLLSTYKPEQAITTHPEFVRAVIHILKKLNCKLFLGDGPSVWAGNISEVDQVYKTTGMYDVCKEEGIELVKFDQSFFIDEIPITAWVKNCDCIVSLPKFKTHDLTTLTGASKNLVGLIPGLFKAELHRRYPCSSDFAKIIIKIAENIRPAISIMDGILALEGEGPATSGKPRELGLILAGSDVFALDIVMAKTMGLNPKDVPTIKEPDEEVEIRGEDPTKQGIKKFELPPAPFTNKIPKLFFPIARKFFYFDITVKKKECIFCKKCFKVCPVGAIKLIEESRSVTIDVKKCIKCFCCREACPTAAIKIKKSFAFKILEKITG